jgi:hypothetical protein
MLGWMEWWWRRQLADEGIQAVIRSQSRIVSRVKLLGWGQEMGAVNTA